MIDNFKKALEEWERQHIYFPEDYYEEVNKVEETEEECQKH